MNRKPKWTTFLIKLPLTALVLAAMIGLINSGMALIASAAAPAWLYVVEGIAAASLGYLAFNDNFEFWKLQRQGP